MGILPKCFGFTDSKHTISAATANKTSTSTPIEELRHRFSFAQLRKITGNFHKSRIIGTLPICDVYRACIDIQGTVREIAIKKFRYNSDQLLAEFKNEIQILCQLRHPNLVSLIGFYKDESRIISVYEYTPNGSLYYHLRSKVTEPLFWKRRLQICIGVARGLHYLHAGVKRTIFHRDVQLMNILLDENFVPKLANFKYCLTGPHAMSKPKPKNLDMVVGSFGYIAPECYRDFIFTDKCDVYSFGMVLLVVLCAMEPSAIYKKMGEMEEQDVNDVENELFEGSHSFAKQLCSFLQKGMAYVIIDPFLIGKIAPQCWKMFMDIAEKCLLEDASERPTMGEVELELEHALALQEEAEAFNPDK
ncbi:hypothetical protein L6164_006665 [Bauhinia variegata]|uniref:Uncharacterized protein n=1 Tax=Bauhinia variegata TaxID=167791 RepID=A0ACB9PUC8_BAUVA|nr:hypothetical protein L6164_006665 [Bauhinia variegata]